jgi:hypothetical protein
MSWETVVYTTSASFASFMAREIYYYVKNRAIKKRRLERIKEANKELSKLDLCPTFVSLAPGRYVTEDSLDSLRNLVIKVEKKKHLHKRVEQIIEKYSDLWKNNGFYEATEIVGVTEIRHPRIGEYETEALHLVTSPFRYFAFLATNANVKLRNDLDEKDKAWLLEQTKDYNPSEPIPTFVNPLSVSVLLLCENRRKFVLTRRSKKTVYRGELIAPSASETVSMLDKKKNNDEIDLVNTVKRALNEELGIQAEHLEDVHFTDLLFDKEAFDYKFTCVVETNLTAEGIKALYSNITRDRFETIDIIFKEFPCEISRNEIMTNWVPEAIATYVKAVIDIYSFNKLKNLVKE